MWFKILPNVNRLFPSKTSLTAFRNNINPIPVTTGKYLGYYRRIHISNLCSLCGHKIYDIPTFPQQSYLISRNKSVYTSHVVRKSKDHDENLKEILVRYPNPQSILNNYYMIVSNELNVQTPMTIHYKASNTKKSSKVDWSSTYVVKWPEEYRVVSTGSTKSEASRKSALKLLSWLDSQSKILKNGQPVLYDKDTVKEIKKESSCIPIELSGDVKEGLEKICMEYDRIKMEMEVVNDFEEETEMIDCVEDTPWSVNKENRSISQYKAVEKMELPIREYRQEIERLLDEKRVVIIRGEPGCGKSSYVPQYLLENWYRKHPDKPAKIAVTQPRRIAAISLAENVASEREEKAGDVIGYQVRLRSQFNPRITRILYLTTGVLLRWMQRDASLLSCTHVVVDEAHERDVNIDLLLCMLRQALKLNPHLKICIMSATVDAQLFSEYFGNAPIIHVHGRRFPVEKYNLREVEQRLKVRLNRTAAVDESDRTEIVADEVADVLHRIHMTADEGAILCFLPGWDEITRVQQSLSRRSDLKSAVVLPLHGRLSNDDQRRIFQRAGLGARKIILTTNVAETSITVDDVVYVVDTGLHRLQRFDPGRRLSSSTTEWINKSNAEQRAGRAGRVRPGYCYRLYTKERHKSMDDYPTPEMLRAPLDKVLLDAKVFSGNADALELFSQLPSPPSSETVQSAITELKRLQLLDTNGDVTRFGRLVSQFPLSPRLGKALIQSITYECVDSILDIVTIFSGDSSEIFSSALINKQAVRNAKLKQSKSSDHIALGSLFNHWNMLVSKGKMDEATQFCNKHSLLPYKLNTIRKLRNMYLQYLESCLDNVPTMDDEFSDNEAIIKGVLLSGAGNVLLQRSWDVVKGRLKKSNVFITSSGHRATVTPESVNGKKKDQSESLYVYINEVKSELRRSVLIRETSSIDPLTLLLFHSGSLRGRYEEDNDDNVILRINNTNIKFLCTAEDADLIENCREVLRSCENYFVHGYTSKVDFKFPEHWKDILRTLNDILG